MKTVTVPVPSWWPTRQRELDIEPAATATATSTVTSTVTSTNDSAASTAVLSKAEALAPPVLPLPLDRAQTAAAWELMDYTTVRAGQRLAAEGLMAQQCLIIASGSAVASRAGERAAVLGAGQTVGLKSVLDDHPQSATVHAVTDVQVLAMTPVQVTALLDAVPPLAQALFRSALRAPA